MSYLKDELQGFVPKPQANDIIKMVTRGSSVMRLSKVEQMTSETKKFPVMTSGPGAYWVGEGQRIKTSKATWIFPEIKAKKLAVIVPVTKEKLEDTTINVFSEMKEVIAEKFAATFDMAALFDEESPFETSLFGSIEANGATVTAYAPNIDISASDTMAVVEEAGYEVDGFAAGIGIKNTLRKLRDANGAPIFVPGTDQDEIYGSPIEFVRNGAWDKTKALLITGAWKYSLVGVRKEIKYEILREATLQGTLDADGKPLSLAEQDMVAIKATMRIGYLCVKPDAFAALVPDEAGAPDCTLSSLTIGSLDLNPVFSRNVTSYTANTTNATNTITAVATDNSATVEIDVDGTTVASGSAATWTAGDNTVTVTVTNGGGSKTYTVTVSKT